GGIFDLDMLAFGRRRRVVLDDGQHRIVEFRRRNPLRLVLVDRRSGFDGLKNTLLLGHGRKNNRDVRKRGDLVADHVFEHPRRLVVLFDEVPFVDQDDNALAILLRQVEDIDILCFDPLRGIQHKHDDIRLFQSFDGPHDGIELNVFLHFSLAPKPGGIDEHKVMAKLVVSDPDGISGGTRDGRHDVTFLSHQRVDQGRLPHVGAAHDRILGKLVVLVPLVFKMLDHFVEQLAGPRARHRRYGVYLAKAEAVKYAGFLLQETVIHLVGHDEHRLAASPQDASNRIVQVSNSGGYVHHKQNHGRFLDGDEHLFADSRLENVVGALHIATRIDYREGLARPIALSVMAVAWYATKVVHDCLAAFGQSIIQGVHTNVRASNDCDDICHSFRNLAGTGRLLKN